MRRNHGFTINELLVVLAIIAICASLFVGFARPSNEMRAANAVKSVLLFARAQALWLGVPVSVTELPLGSGLTVRRQPPGVSGGCTNEGSSVVNRLLFSDYPGVRLAAGFRAGGLLWLPSGSGRGCDGSGVISSTLRVASLTGAAEVIISSLGRVRVERAP